MLLRHGFGRRANSGQVGISSAVEDGHLRLTVYDNGVGLPDDWQLKGAAALVWRTPPRVCNNSTTTTTSLIFVIAMAAASKVVIVMPMRTVT